MPELHEWVPILAQQQSKIVRIDKSESDATDGSIPLSLRRCHVPLQCAHESYLWQRLLRKIGKTNMREQFFECTILHKEWVHSFWMIAKGVLAWGGFFCFQRVGQNNPSKLQINLLKYYQFLVSNSPRYSNLDTFRYSATAHSFIPQILSMNSFILSNSQNKLKLTLCTWQRRPSESECQNQLIFFNSF